LSGDGALLDTRYSAETPEGIALALSPAGVPVRCWAFTIDLTIRLLLLGVLGVALGTFGGIGQGVFLIAFFALDWFYPVFFELLPGSATPGKRALRLRVVMDTGLPVTPAASLMRNLLRFADFMPMLWAAGAACMLVRPDGKRLGDLAAGTLVVHVPAAAKASPSGFSSGVSSGSPSGSPSGFASGPSGATPRPPAVALGARGQAAVVAWAARVPLLTRARADELAALAVPVVAPRSGAHERVEVLAGVAEWILGRRPEARKR